MKLSDISSMEKWIEQLNQYKMNLSSTMKPFFEFKQDINYIHALNKFDEGDLSAANYWINFLKLNIEPVILIFLKKYNNRKIEKYPSIKDSRLYYSQQFLLKAMLTDSIEEKKKFEDILSISKSLIEEPILSISTFGSLQELSPYLVQLYCILELKESKLN